MPSKPRRPSPSTERGSGHRTPTARQLAAVRVEAETLLADIAEAVRACLARRRWDDLKAAIESYAKLLRMPPVRLFNHALLRVLTQHALTTTSLAECVACSDEIARLMGPSAESTSLEDVIHSLKLAARWQDTLGTAVQPEGRIH